MKLVTEGDTHKKRGAAMRQLEEAGIEVVADSRRGLMHNKFAVIDGAILWNGSYNATRNDGWKNNNNALAVRSPELADIYNDEFMEMFRDRVFGNRKEPGPFAELRKAVPCENRGHGHQRLFFTGRQHRADHHQAD